MKHMKKNSKNHYQIKISNLVWFIIVVFFIGWFFWPVNEDTFFSFEIDQTQEYIDGEVLFDNISFGYTNKGRILVPLLNKTPSEMLFKGNYSEIIVEFLYDFPSDYLEQSEIFFEVPKDELDYRVQYQLIKDKDLFKNISELHWGHMPLKYKFENECAERLSNLTKLAFTKIRLETNSVVSFVETTEEPDISIYCRPYQGDTRTGESILGDALKMLNPTSENLIDKGEINIYGQGRTCGTGYPALEVHEILHLFGIPHNSFKDNVMGESAYGPSNKCRITKIDSEYVSCLKYVYSNGAFEGSCSFSSYSEGNGGLV